MDLRTGDVYYQYAVQHIEGPKKYWSVQPTTMQLKVCGYSEPFLRVKLEVLNKPEKDCMWAWHSFVDHYDKPKKSLRNVFSSELQVKCCSPDFFQLDIKAGKGKIVPVRLTISNEEKS